MPQLDGLRAMAVALVMVFHFNPWVDRYAPLGTIGVRLFFALSGFLITGILLSWRGQNLRVALTSFYARRGLRIFPLFYFALAAAALFNIGPVRDTFAWHVSYLSNVYFYLRGDWHGSVSHLWSLAVEEQFYLVWPWIILCVPERRLAPIVGAMVLLAPVSRLLMPGAMGSVLPTSCLDALGLGALLALGSTREAIAKAGLWIGAPLVAVALSQRYAGVGGAYQAVVLDFGISWLSAWMVGGAATGFAGVGGAVLALAPVRYLGRISYGLYVYHGFTPYLMGRYVPGFTSMDWPHRFALLTLATGLVAAISWHLLERPFLRLKPPVPLGTQ